MPPHSPTEPSLKELLAAITAARTPEDRYETVMRYGPAAVAHPELLAGLRERAAAVRRGGRPAEADRLDAWRSEVERRVTQQRLMDELVNAPNDAQRQAVLAREGDAVDGDWVGSALTEARNLLRHGDPVAALAAVRIVDVAISIATFLGGGVHLARALVGRWEARYRQGDPEGALADLSAAAELFRDAGDTFEYGKCLSMAGSQLLELGREHEALEVLRRSLPPLEEVDEQRLLAPTLEEIGGILLRRGDEAASVATMVDASRHRLAAGQPQRALPHLGGAVAWYLVHEQVDDALSCAETFVEAAAELPAGAEVDPEAVELIRTTAISAVAVASPESDYAGGGAYGKYIDRRRWSLATRWLRVAERVHPLAPTDVGAAYLALARGHCGLVEGDAEVAEKGARSALDWFEAQEMRTETRSCAIILMSAAALRGELELARRWSERALELADGDGATQAAVLTARGEYLVKAGDRRGALEAHRAAVNLVRRASGPLAGWSAGAAQDALASTYVELGDPLEAMSTYADALSTAVAIDHRRGQASVLQGMGRLLAMAGNGDFGSLTAGQVAELMQHVPDPPVNVAGPAALRLAAVNLLERAVAAFAELHDDPGQASALSDLSNVVPADRAQWRLELVTEVVERKRAVGDSLGEAVALANLGLAYESLGDRSAAIASLEESLTNSRRSGYALSAAKSATSLGELREQAGDVEEAEARYAEAVELIESIRVGVPRTDAYMLGFARQHGTTYERLVDLLVARGMDDAAFDLVQRAKSRALLDLLGTTQLVPTVPVEGLFGELLERERSLLPRLRAGEAVDAGPQLDALYAEMEEFDPSYVGMRRGSPATSASLRAWLRAQLRPALLVEYFVSDTHLTVFGLRAEWPDVRVRVHEFARSELRDSYAAFRRDVVQYRSQGGQGWAQISRQLVEPLRGWLNDGDLVCLVPHSLLHALPIHALPLEGEPLIVAHPVAYTPTAGLLALAHNAAKGTGALASCAAFGVVFAEEAEAVARVFDTEPMDVDGLTPDRVQRMAHGKDVCHFSCHGAFDVFDPLSSGLFLSADEDRASRMTARDVMEMRLDNELVCLSACETALSELSGGDELIGLVRSFLYAGVPSIVASLWQVDADTTQELMVRFYRALRAEGPARPDKAEALRTAQLEMMRASGPRMAWRWAPFVLIGDTQ